MHPVSFTVVYIHGFNSSPQSHKAQQLKQWLAEQHPDIQCVLPALSPYPLEAMAQLEAQVQQAPESTGLIGSSLGGFYAAYLSEKYSVPAVLINPAVRPFETLSRYLGDNENFHTREHYELTQQHVDDLASLYVPEPSASARFWLMVQTADEALDFREATAHYSSSPALIEYGGDHSFQQCERWFPQMLTFLQAAVARN
jgi:predicted esterase YcpF (UPF0227 family)